MFQQAVVTFIVFLLALIADRAINAGMQVWAAKRIARDFMRRHRSHDTLPDAGSWKQWRKESN